MVFKQRQKAQRNLPESNKKIITKIKNQFSIKFQIYPAINLKVETYILIPNFTSQK